MPVLITIVIILILILLVRIGVEAEYSTSGFSAAANIAFVKIKLYPREKASKKEKPSKKSDSDKTADNKKGGLLPGFWGIVELAKNTLSRLRRKLLVNKLILHYTAACDDPFDAVMAYGRASAGISAIYPTLTNIFNIKKSEFFTSVDFTTTDPLIYANIKLSISIGSILYIAITLLIDYLRVKNREKNDSTGEVADKNQAADFGVNNRKAD